MSTDIGDRFNAAVAAEIRAQRARTSVTIADLVTATGISKSRMLKLVHAKIAIEVRDIARIGKALDIEPVELFRQAQASLDRQKTK